MKITKFEELNIWKLSLKITKDIYDVSSKRSFYKDFPLRDHIRKSMISVSSNIVEGFEKNNNNEFIRFLKIAKGSVGEARNQIYIALATNYITKNEFNKINKDLEELARQIGAFTAYLQRKRKNKEFQKK